MKTMPFIAACLAASVTLSTPAQAQWVFQQKAHPLAAGEVIQFAITSATNGNRLEVQCRSAEHIIVFLTQIPARDVSALNFGAPQLLVTLDDGETLALDTYLDVAEDRVAASTPLTEQALPLLDQMMNASSIVTVSVSLFGETLHETQFSLAGSSRAIGRVSAGCEGV